MATKKPTKPKQPPLTVTIRQVEDSRPCSFGDYVNCLTLIKSRPVPGGLYDEPFPGSAKRKFPKKSRYGPDDPISLSELASVLPSPAMIYLGDHFLTPAMRNAIERRAREIEDNAYAIAMREILASPTKKQGKTK